MAFSISPVLFWLLVLVASLCIEAMSVQLLTIWCAGGAVGAMIAAWLDFGVGVQLVVFVVVTVVLVFLLRPLTTRLLSTKQDKTNADRIIGQTAVVVQRIDTHAPSGQVRVLGQVWTARSTNPEDVFEEGEKVVVQSISGVKAMVSRIS